MTQATARAGFSYQEIVREIRAAGLSTGDIAKATGVKERQVQHWAAGSSPPSRGKTPIAWSTRTTSSAC